MESRSTGSRPSPARRVRRTDKSRFPDHGEWPFVVCMVVVVAGGAGIVDAVLRWIG